MTSLPTFSPGAKAAVFGASGGIGGALVDRLNRDPAVDTVVALSRHRPDNSDDSIPWIPFDLDSEETLQTASDRLKAGDGSLRLILVATGILHDERGVVPEKTIKSLTGTAMDRAFKINATGPALIAKHFAPLLSKDKKSILVFLSARVGSITDNEQGGWYSYRASKAALHMIVKTLSIELRRTHPRAICVAIHPGTVHTSLSRPFIAEKARTAMQPHDAAVYILNVINGLELDHSGRIWDWQSKEVDP